MASLPIQTIAVPWFNDDQHLQWVQDEANLHISGRLSYDEWLHFATMTEDHIRIVLGVAPIRVPIEYDKWSAWCVNNEKEPNLASVRDYAEVHKDDTSKDLGQWHHLFPRSEYQGS